jgi:EAL domain-containing protein (putative c-di-GMP-specific phosphodiesterase class I)
VSAGLVERPGRWALPPAPPETWIGSTAALGLVAGAALAVVVPGLVLLPDAAASTFVLAGLYALGGLLALVSAYLLVLQASVTQDRRLAWVAGGFATLYAVYLARSGNAAVPGRAAALSLGWLLVLPVVTVAAGLLRHGVRLLALAFLVLPGLGWAAYALPLVEADGVRTTPLGHALLLAAGALGLGTALWWRTQVPNGNRGSWGWVGATLLLLPVVALLRASSRSRNDPAAWASLVVEVVVLAVPAIGLCVLSVRGYLRQARRWRQLEGEVRRLRASSALLPGLSVTPEDEGGLPHREEVADLLARRGYRIALQPIIHLASGETVGQEALARFGGRVPADLWFRAASRYGLGLALERLTLAAALVALETLPAGEFLAVNASPAALHDEQVLALLHGCDLRRLVVEITEHEAVTDYARTRTALGALRAGGARIAVDDVGAGFASLRHVLLLQPDIVKLDTSLTRDVHDNPRQQAIVRAVATFSTEVGATVLAEGIEATAQIGALIECGVALGQGWLLGAPAVAG